jgi:hypothetical protein
MQLGTQHETSPLLLPTKPKVLLLPKLLLLLYTTYELSMFNIFN